jgi:hypothetical protein
MENMDWIAEKREGRDNTGKRGRRAFPMPEKPDREDGWR